MNKKSRRKEILKSTSEYISAFIISLVISLVIFFILQGFLVDQLDDFIARDLDSEVVSNISILNFVIFTYQALILIVFSITFYAIIKKRDLITDLFLAYLTTLMLLYVISYFCLKIKYPTIIGIEFFFVSQGLFMVHCLQSELYFYILNIVIFIIFFNVFMFKEQIRNFTIKQSIKSRSGKKKKFKIKIIM